MGFSAHSDKLIKLKYSCDKYGIDIVTLSETNVNWKKVRPAQTLRGRTKFWKEDIRTIAGHNITAPQAPHHQYGGTAVISMNKAAHCFFKGDRDFRKLGRWTSMTYRGKWGTQIAASTCSFHILQGKAVDCIAGQGPATKPLADDSIPTQTQLDYNTQQPGPGSDRAGAPWSGINLHSGHARIQVNGND